MIEPDSQARCSSLVFKPSSQAWCSSLVFKPGVQAQCSSLVFKPVFLTLGKPNELTFSDAPFTCSRLAFGQVP